MTAPSSYARLWRGGGLVTLGNAASAGLGLVLLLLLARTLAPAQLAIVAGVIAVIDGGHMFLDATVNTAMVNIASRQGRKGAPSAAILKAGFYTKLAGGVIFALVVALAAPWMSWALVGDGAMRGVIMLAGVAGAIAAMQGFVVAVMVAHEAFAKIAFVSVWKNLLRILAVAPFVLGAAQPLSQM